MSEKGVKLTCTDTIPKERVSEYVYESFGKFDAINQSQCLTILPYAFPDEEIIRNLTSYVNSAPVYCVDFTFCTEFYFETNLLEIFCTSTGGSKEYKPVKVFSGRFLKEA